MAFLVSSRFTLSYTIYSIYQKNKIEKFYWNFLTKKSNLVASVYKFVTSILFIIYPIYIDDRTYIWYNHIGYIWNISDAFPFIYQKISERWWFYDKKRIISIYYNITPILSSYYFTPKIAKASDFTTLWFQMLYP